MNKIISIDLRADFGFLKKPDTNDPIYLTFNMLHKPALLGIFGAILGLGGFSQAKEEEQKQPKPKRGQKVKIIFPEYYQKLKTVKVGIKPIRINKDGKEDPAFDGNFQKTNITYNNGVGYANLDGGNLIVTEQTLVSPAYRCYISVDSGDPDLLDCLQRNKSEFIPYLGKNEFSLWWDNFQEYEFAKFVPDNISFKISTIFIKEEPIKDGKQMQTAFSPSAVSNSRFMLFENLPVSYNEELVQYEYRSFGYTDWELKANYQVSNLYKITNSRTIEVIQLF